MKQPSSAPAERKQSDARRIVNEVYPFLCCVVCGLQLETCLTVAHLDQNPANNDPDNLARMCQTHHWMFDAALYPTEAIKLLRAHWQSTKGVPNHKARMKDAGARAAYTKMRRAAARKAVATKAASAPRPNDT